MWTRPFEPRLRWDPRRRAFCPRRDTLSSRPRWRHCSSQDLGQDVRWERLSTTNLDQHDMNGVLSDHVNMFLFLSFSYHLLETIIMACTLGLHFRSCRSRPLGLSQCANNKSLNCKKISMKWICRLLVKHNHPVNTNQLKSIKWLSNCFHILFISICNESICYSTGNPIQNSLHLQVSFATN